MKPLKVDLHVHTMYSRDSNTEPVDLVRRARELGFDAIGVTDHGTVKGALEAERFAETMARDLTIFIGQEVKTKQGEVLAYNIRDSIRENRELIETCREIKGRKGFLVIPHPFDAMRKGIGKNTERVLEYADAVEVFNARTIVSRFNRKAMEFAREKKMAFVAGSDAHFLDEFGGTYMLVESGKTTVGILGAIRGGRAELVMQGPSMGSGLKRGLRKVITCINR
jgi:predicted metal-dependent phosphoesterase TrpH